MPEIATLIILTTLLNLFAWAFSLSPDTLQIINIITGAGLGIPTLLYIRSLNAPYVPTSAQTSTTMLELAQITSTSIVYELGCGDGHIIRQAAKWWAQKTIGYELSFLLVAYAWVVGKWQKNSAQVIRQNFFHSQFQDATVIFCFLSLRAMQKIEETIWPQLPSGARLVSNSFPLPHILPAQIKNGVYLYIKP